MFTGNIADKIIAGRNGKSTSRMTTYFGKDKLLPPYTPQLL